MHPLKILKAHGHHFIFILSILALGSLVVWWSIFIRNSIQQQRLYRYDKLETDLKFIAFKLGTDGSRQPDNKSKGTDSSRPVTSQPKKANSNKQL